MTLDQKPRRWAGAIRTVTLGSGSRRALTVGGGNGLPLHTFEDKIADETVCTELEPLIEHLAAAEHPALEMGEMI